MKDTVVAGLFTAVANISFIGLLFKWQDSKTKKIEEKTDENSKAIFGLDDKYLTEKEHKLLCDNSTLRLEQKFEQSFTSLKDDIFINLRELKDTITENNNGKD